MASKSAIVQVPDELFVMHIITNELSYKGIRNDRKKRNKRRPRQDYNTVSLSLDI